MLSSGIFPFAKQDTVLVSQERWEKKEKLCWYIMSNNTLRAWRSENGV
jgi:hypothetical protein